MESISENNFDLFDVVKKLFKSFLNHYVSVISIFILFAVAGYLLEGRVKNEEYRFSVPVSNTSKVYDPLYFSVRNLLVDSLYNGEAAAIKPLNASNYINEYNINLTNFFKPETRALFYIDEVKSQNFTEILKRIENQNFRLISITFSKDSKKLNIFFENNKVNDNPPTDESKLQYSLFFMKELNDRINNKYKEIASKSLDEYATNIYNYVNSLNPTEKFNTNAANYVTDLKKEILLLESFETMTGQDTSILSSGTISASANPLQLEKIKTHKLNVLELIEELILNNNINEMSELLYMIPELTYHENLKKNEEVYQNLLLQIQKTTQILMASELVNYSMNEIQLTDYKTGNDLFVIFIFGGFFVCVIYLFYLSYRKEILMSL